MGFYKQLLGDTAADRERMLEAPALLRGIQGDIPRQAYLAFLGEAYHHVRHTVPLLMACGARLPVRLEWLREAVAEYIEEETGHQEWILNDIRAAGGDAEAVCDGLPHATTELMVAYAYDGIARGNPASLFGMVLVLEGTSVALATQAAGRIQRTLDLPDTAFSYLSSHGSLDQEHIRFYEKLMDRLDDADDRAAVTHAARMFYHLYGEIFRSLPLDKQERDAA